MSANQGTILKEDGFVVLPYHEFIKEQVEMLKKGIVETTQSENYKKFLEICANNGLRRFSVRNKIMILSQCPNASIVLGKNQWKERFNRKLKENEWKDPIRIWCPSKKKGTKKNSSSDDEKASVADNDFEIKFVLGKVFNLEQTEGDPLPAEICQTIQGNTEEAAEIYTVLKQNSKIPVEEIQSYRYNGSFLSDPVTKKPIKITLKKELPINHKARTLIHESIHYLLNTKNVQEEMKEVVGENKNKLYAIEEVITESITYICCQRFGLPIGSYSFEYVSTWADEGINTIETIYDLVHKNANLMLDRIEQLLEKNEKKVAN